MERTNNQRIFKGCSCKRSQCIKNYCDCYQSMIICTKFCKCVGCRNTEHRVSASKPLTTKKERVLTNAAATYINTGNAVGAGIATIISNDPFIELANVQYQQEAAAMAAVNIASTTAALTTATTMSFQQKFPQYRTQRGGAGCVPTLNAATAQTLLPPQQAPKVYTLFTTKLNDAILNVHVQQAEEAAHNGLNDEDQCVLIINEFVRNLSRAYKAAFMD